LRGIGVARDYAKALQYFTQAANMPIARSSNALGVVDAKFHLGSMYYSVWSDG
jgi:TPR repeat protein